MRSPSRCCARPAAPGLLLGLLLLLTASPLPARGWTALLWAAGEGRLECVKLLHARGASLAQCTELVNQLRGRADKRQVEGARVAPRHNIGLGGACVVTMYRGD